MVRVGWVKMEMVMVKQEMEMGMETTGISIVNNNQW